MKKIEAMIPTIKRTEVVEAIMKAGAGGVTVVESRGKGAGERPTVSKARGTTMYVAGYNRIDTITTIVDDSKVKEIETVILDAASTGGQGDGKIFIIPIEEAVDIGSRQKGTGSI